MPESLPNNTTVSHYRIVSHLGTGGMGEVYLAEDTRLNRKVALKVLPENFAADKDRLRRFEQEAHAVSVLNHPNILTIYEFGFETDIHFLATELIEGKTLREIMDSGELSLSETLNIAEQTAFALSAAHAAGIVHRDLKPENIMIRRDGIVKVLDFGLAKLTEKKEEESDSEAATRALVQTKAGVVMGTAGYMSPEQAKGKETDERTDIWSFGVVLYEMVSSELPFTGETANERIASILKSEPIPISHHTSSVPKELERIIGKTLRKNREERYQHIKDLWLDLKDLKQEIEFQNKLERTAAPHREEPKTQTPNATTTDVAHTTSSAEYIASGIKQHKRSFGAGLVILLIAAVGLGYWFFAHRSANATQIESIAVLPFVNQSGNDDTEYLSDGMTETLISSLSQIPKLNIKARSSVFRYKGKETDAQTVGKELNVQAILNGRVVQRGDELVLYLELVDATTGNRIWGDQYNKKLANLVSLQTEIARDVSDKLRVRLSGADEQRLAKNYTDNTEAYQLYLRGRFYSNRRTVKDIRKSIEYFQQAVTLDPNYTLAYTGLADAYSVLSTYGGAPSNEVVPKAREAALKALSLDNQLAESHISLGIILNYYDYDFAGGEREFQRAIELNPNLAMAHQSYAILLSNLGRHEEALNEIRRALEIEPLSPLSNRSYGIVLLYARRYDESAEQLKKTLELDANFIPAYDTLGNAYRLQGRYADSVEAYASSQEALNNFEAAALRRESFAKGGWQGFLRDMTDNPQLNNLKSSYIVATFHTELGEKDKALAALSKAYEEREFFITLLKVDPRLDPLREDPRFQELLKRVGLTP
jgi:serine/threonine-protein kinase